MSLKKSQETLSDQIAELLVTVPGSQDPEIQDETSAKLDSKIAIEEYEDDEQTLSTIRKLNVDLLSDIDKRYSGKKSSRKKCQDLDLDVSEDDNVESDHSSVDGEGDLSSNLGEEEDKEESSGGEEEDVEEPNEQEHEIDSFQQLKQTNTSLHIQKGLCVKNQLNIWENLLEMRIQLQKSLIAGNKMPQNDKYKEIQKESGNIFVNKVTETKNNLFTLLNKLQLLQNLLLKQFPETKNIYSTTNKSDDDEEIQSNSEDEMLETEEPPKKKMYITDYEEEINQRHVAYKDYRNNVIQKWHEKTQITSLKNYENNHSILSHIEYTLSDREKLLKRTQLKRSDCQIVGEPAKTDQDDTTEEYNPEIFCDDDFYHQLLRELIEVKSADLTDPVQLGRQWMQLQNLRSKMKRKVDTRATKGRKIRYAVHSKLVNFMAPIEENPWTDEAKTELYNSLFGKNAITAK